MIIERSFDIEDEVRQALEPYFDIYCRPLPKDFKVPSLLVTQAGGGDRKSVDNFTIVIDSRGETDSEALNLLLDATGTLRAIAKTGNTNIRHVEINTSGTWGRDPVHPELALASATLVVYTHKFKKNITIKEN